MNNELYTLMIYWSKPIPPYYSDSYKEDGYCIIGTYSTLAKAILMYNTYIRHPQTILDEVIKANNYDPWSYRNDEYYIDTYNVKKTWTLSAYKREPMPAAEYDLYGRYGTWQDARYFGIRLVCGLGNNIKKRRKRGIL